jgi:hypothetical protein
MQSLTDEKEHLLEEGREHLLNVQSQNEDLIAEN